MKPGDPQNVKIEHKGEQKWAQEHHSVITPDHFGSHFPSKINEKIDAKIDAEKVMKNHEKSCKNRSIFG